MQIAILFGAFVLCSIVLAVYIGAILSLKKSCTTKVEAKCISHCHMPNSGKDYETDVPVLAFELNGEQMTISEESSKDVLFSTKPKLNETVILYLNPNDKSEYYTKWTIRNVTYSMICVLLIIIAIATGCYIFC